MDTEEIDNGPNIEKPCTRGWKCAVLGHALHRSEASKPPAFGHQAGPGHIQDKARKAPTHAGRPAKARPDGRNTRQGRPAAAGIATGHYTRNHADPSQQTHARQPTTANHSPKHLSTIHPNKASDILYIMFYLSRVSHESSVTFANTLKCRRD